MLAIQQLFCLSMLHSNSCFFWLASKKICLWLIKILISRITKISFIRWRLIINISFLKQVRRSTSLNATYLSKRVAVLLANWCIKIENMQKVVRKIDIKFNWEEANLSFTRINMIECSMYQYCKNSNAQRKISKFSFNQNYCSF